MEYRSVKLCWVFYGSFFATHCQNLPVCLTPPPRPNRYVRVSGSMTVDHRTTTWNLVVLPNSRWSGCSLLEICCGKIVETITYSLKQFDQRWQWCNNVISTFFKCHYFYIYALTKSADTIYQITYNTFEKILQHIHFIEKDMTLVIKSICAHFKMLSNTIF